MAAAIIYPTVSSLPGMIELMANLMIEHLYKKSGKSNCFRSPYIYIYIYTNEIKRGMLELSNQITWDTLLTTNRPPSTFKDNRTVSDLFRLPYIPFDSNHVEAGAEETKVGERERGEKERRRE